MGWRVAKSLLQLREQVNAAYPNRDKSSDGTIGDARHRATKSEHNPDHNGVVRAMDITHDPKNGIDARKLAEAIVASKDPRVMYIISNGQIVSASVSPWQWRKYSGSNGHFAHCHISVVSSPALYDDTRAWALPGAAPAPELPPEPGHIPTPSLRLKHAKNILDFEARRDKNGHLAVYKLPRNDRGGTYEVAGINDRYHPSTVTKLMRLLAAGRHDEAETEAIEYIADCTDIAAKWHSHPAVESYLRDCAFNRGVRGATRIVQRAVGVPDDGIIGPVTQAAIAKYQPAELLLKLRQAREDYERAVVGVRKNLWAGLVNRWDGALKTAQSFLEKTA